jgi:hypothetical protein
MGKARQSEVMARVSRWWIGSGAASVPWDTGGALAHKLLHELTTTSGKDIKGNPLILLLCFVAIGFLLLGCTGFITPRPVVRSHPSPPSYFLAVPKTTSRSLKTRTWGFFMGEVLVAISKLLEQYNIRPFGVTADNTV